MAKDSLRFLGDNDSSVNCTCDILDKSTAIFNYVQYMLDRTSRMFKYSGLPHTIPEYLLEYMLQTYGSVGIIRHEGSLYCVRVQAGGPPDPYYRPTSAVVANPALKIGATFRIVNYLPPFDKETWDSYPPCVRGHNDTQLIGLIPLFARYATQMAENDVSVRSAQINLRQQTVIVADTGPEQQSAEVYIKNLEAGKLSAIVKRPFGDGIQVNDVKAGSSHTIIQLIELQQYLKASWYNEIGLNSNFNMKRQYMSADEVNAAADIMLPLIDNMYECRKDFVEAINKEFGTEISVEKDSAWEKKQIQSDIATSFNPDTGEPIEVSSVNGTQEVVPDEAEEDLESDKSE